MIAGTHTIKYCSCKVSGNKDPTKASTFKPLEETAGTINELIFSML